MALSLSGRLGGAGRRLRCGDDRNRLSAYLPVWLEPEQRLSREQHRNSTGSVTSGSICLPRVAELAEIGGNCVLPDRNLSAGEAIGRVFH